MNEFVKLYKENPVRVIEKDGELWFVAKDVAVILGYRDAYTLVRRLDEDERGTRKVCTPSAEQEMTVINEAGLYNAILCSNKAEAKAFKRWVTHEVLPSIRKNGGYINGVNIETVKGVFDKVRNQIVKMTEEMSKLQEKLEYAEQFTPINQYGSKNKKGEKRLLIRRGSNVTGKRGKCIKKRNPDEVGFHQVDLFTEVFPIMLFDDDVNKIY